MPGGFVVSFKVDRIWLRLCYRKIPIYPIFIFYLHKADYRVLGSRPGYLEGGPGCGVAQDGYEGSIMQKQADKKRENATDTDLCAGLDLIASSMGLGSSYKNSLIGKYWGPACSSLCVHNLNKFLSSCS